MYIEISTKQIRRTENNRQDKTQLQQTRSIKCTAIRWSFIFYCYIHFIVFLREVRAALPGYVYSSRKSKRCPVLQVHAGSFRVSVIHRQTDVKQQIRVELIWIALVQRAVWNRLHSRSQKFY